MTPSSLIAFLISFLIGSVYCAPSELSCNFDDGLEACGFRDVSYSGRGSWQVEDYLQNPNDTLISGPQKVNNGKFFKSNGESRFWSNNTELSGDICFSLDYYVFGPWQSIKINLVWMTTEYGREQGKYHRRLFFRNEFSSDRDEWRHYETTLKFGQPATYHLDVEGKGYREDEFGSHVAIDNLKFEQGACPTRTVRTCEFDAMPMGWEPREISNEHLMCDWITANRSQWKIDIGEWDRSAGYGEGGILGPTFEHEHGWSKFSIRVEPDSDVQCFSFWIGPRQNGPMFTITQLDDPDQEMFLGTRLEPIISSDSTVNSRSWEMYNVELRSRSSVSYLSMRVKQNRRDWQDEFSNVKLDSLRLERGQCPKPGHCDFRTGFCSYQSPLIGGTITKKTWFWGRGRYAGGFNMPLPQIRPEGSYVYTDFSGVARSDFRDHNSTLESDLIRTRGVHCLTFESLARNRVRELSIEKHEFGPSEPIVKNLYSFEQHQIPSEWTFKNITIPISTKGSPAFKIVFRVRGKAQAFVAIRTVAIERGSCPNDNITDVVTPGRDVNFHCYQTGHYITQYRSCDGVIDCPMGEDEGEHCVNRACQRNGLPCRMGDDHFCLETESKFCDGHRDCDDGIDEDPRFCDQKLRCDNYCLNNGECNEKYNCQCELGFTGKRCHLAT